MIEHTLNLWVFLITILSLIIFVFKIIIKFSLYNNYNFSKNIAFFHKLSNVQDQRRKMFIMSDMVE